MLRPGMSVLDVGCGTGAITAGIARAVGPSGRAVGVDRDEAMLEIARREHSDVEFVQGDALDLPYDAEFDIATAARALQWIADPARAVAGMARAVKPGGIVIALDYNHDRNLWAPDPPPEFARFYAAFLACARPTAGTTPSPTICLQRSSRPEWSLSNRSRATNSWSAADPTSGERSSKESARNSTRKTSVRACSPPMMNIGPRSCSGR